MWCKNTSAFHSVPLWPRSLVKMLRGSAMANQASVSVCVSLSLSVTITAKHSSLRPDAVPLALAEAWRHCLPCNYGGWRQPPNWWCRQVCPLSVVLLARGWNPGDTDSKYSPSCTTVSPHRGYWEPPPSRLMPWKKRRHTWWPSRTPCWRVLTSRLFFQILSCNEKKEVISVQTQMCVMMDRSAY